MPMTIRICIQILLQCCAHFNSANLAMPQGVPSVSVAYAEGITSKMADKISSFTPSSKVSQRLIVQYTTSSQAASTVP